MTRDEAERESERLSREHPDRATHHWFAREASPSDWSVVRAALPEAVARQGMRATVEAKPRPQQADDPRQWWERLIPPYGGWGGGGGA
jgi:hypothetical protein